MLQVEKLLAEVDALNTQQGNDNLTAEALESRTRLYERVASEVSRLKYFLTKGHQLPSLQQLQPRADSAVEKLSRLLRQALDGALRSGHQSAVLHCLQAYAAVGDTAGAEQVQHRLPGSLCCLGWRPHLLHCENREGNNVQCQHVWQTLRNVLLLQRFSLHLVTASGSCQQNWLPGH